MKKIIVLIISFASDYMVVQVNDVDAGSIIGIDGTVKGTIDCSEAPSQGGVTDVLSTVMSTNNGKITIEATKKVFGRTKAIEEVYYFSKKETCQQVENGELELLVLIRSGLNKVFPASEL